MFQSTLWILLSLVIVTDSVNYRKAGGEAVLTSATVSGSITSITWKHGPDIAVEWYGDTIDEYREFKGRCQLDFTTGALTIVNLTLTDSGIYTAEINNKVMSPTDITVISAVPKPTVSTQCSSEGTSCNFTCGDSVTGAEPVTYSWAVDNKAITGSSKSLEIKKDDPDMAGKVISCQLENPVSSERSGDVIIPFTNSNSLGVEIGVPVAIGIIVAVAVGLFFCCRHRCGGKTLNKETSGRSQQQTTGDTHERADERMPFLLTSNGTAVYTKVDETRNEEQNSEAPQPKDEAEPSERREETSGETEEGAEVTRSDIQEVSNQNRPDTVPTDDTEGTPFLSTSNGTGIPQSSPEMRNESGPDDTSAEDGDPSSEPAVYTKVDETHNEEQNSEVPQPKDEAEPSERREETSGETGEGAEVTRSDIQEVSNQNRPDTVPTDDTDASKVESDEEGTPEQEEQEEQGEQDNEDEDNTTDD